MATGPSLRETALETQFPDNTYLVGVADIKNDKCTGFYTATEEEVSSLQEKYIDNRWFGSRTMDQRSVVIQKALGDATYNDRKSYDLAMSTLSESYLVVTDRHIGHDAEGTATGSHRELFYDEGRYHLISSDTKDLETLDATLLTKQNIFIKARDNYEKVVKNYSRNPCEKTLEAAFANYEVARRSFEHEITDRRNKKIDPESPCLDAAHAELLKNDTTALHIDLAPRRKAVDQGGTAPQKARANLLAQWDHYIAIKDYLSTGTGRYATDSAKESLLFSATNGVMNAMKTDGISATKLEIEKNAKYNEFSSDYEEYSKPLSEDEFYTRIIPYLVNDEKCFEAPADILKRATPEQKEFITLLFQAKKQGYLDAAFEERLYALPKKFVYNLCLFSGKVGRGLDAVINLIKTKPTALTSQKIFALAAKNFKDNHLKDAAPWTPEEEISEDTLSSNDPKLKLLRKVLPGAAAAQDAARREKEIQGYFSNNAQFKNFRAALTHIKDSTKTDSVEKYNHYFSTQGVDNQTPTQVLETLVYPKLQTLGELHHANPPDFGAYPIRARLMDPYATTSSVYSNIQKLIDKQLFPIYQIKQKLLSEELLALIQITTPSLTDLNTVKRIKVDLEQLMKSLPQFKNSMEELENYPELKNINRLLETIKDLISTADNYDSTYRFELEKQAEEEAAAAAEAAAVAAAAVAVAAPVAPTAPPLHLLDGEEDEQGTSCVIQ